MYAIATRKMTGIHHIELLKRKCIKSRNWKQSQLYAKDVQEAAQVSRTKAIEMIKSYGGSKDVSERWCIDARKFFACYNSPARNLAAGGGGKHVDIEKIMGKIREFSKKHRFTSLKLQKPKSKPNWQLRVYGSDKKESVISLGTSSKKEAKELEALIRSNLMRQAIDGIIPRKTETFLWEWLTIKEKEVAPNTAKRYKAVIDKALDFMANEVHETKTHHAEQYRQWLLRGDYKPRSIIMELNTLKQAFNDARKLGYTNQNPFEDVKIPTKPPTEVVCYTQAELNSIFEELDRRCETGQSQAKVEAWKTYREIIYCLFYTGMRVGDAVKLRWDEVDLIFDTVTFQQEKTKKQSCIRLQTEFVARLRGLAQASVEPTGYVFKNTSGNIVQTNHVNNAMRTVLQACKIEKKSPLHSFRHTTAMLLFDARKPPHEVANQLGDSVETIVRTYVKPQLPERGSLDRAFTLGSRKGHENMEEMQVLEAVGGSPAIPLNHQKTAKEKGFLENSRKPSSTTKM